MLFCGYDVIIYQTVVNGENISNTWHEILLNWTLTMSSAVRCYVAWFKEWPAIPVFYILHTEAGSSQSLSRMYSSYKQ
jgi:glutaredoxin-related protein